jgi:alpha-amylase
MNRPQSYSRLLFSREVLVAYNVSTTDTHDFHIIVDANFQKDRPSMKFLYGGTGTVPVLKHADPNDPTRFIKLNLKPMQYVILK